MTQRFEIHAKGPGAKRAELRIYGDIGEDWMAEESNDAKTMVGRLGEISATELDVRINSYGGSVADGLAIYNALRRHSARVTTHIDGVGFSIASLIAMAGDEVRMANNALLMIHAPWGGAVGNARELRDMANVLDKYAEAMTGAYLRDGGPDRATVADWLSGSQDHYFTATEAAEIGLVDVIDAAQLDIAAALRPATSRFSIPAGLARPTSSQEPHMANSEQTPGGSESTPATNQQPAQQPQAAAVPDYSDIVAKHSRTTQAAHHAGMAAEAKRRQTVAEVFSGFYDGDPLNPITAVYDSCMENVNCDELEARRHLLGMLSHSTSDPILSQQHYQAPAPSEPPPQASRHLGGMPPYRPYYPQANQQPRGYSQAYGRVSGGDDNSIIGMRNALEIRAGLITDPKAIEEERKGEFLSLSLTDYMSRELRASGMQVGGTREDIARRYVRSVMVLGAGPSQGTDHLPAVLGDIAQKSAMAGFGAAEETWRLWTVSGVLNDYKPHTRANVALLDKLDKMRENQPWEFGSLEDVKQSIIGYFYGKKYGLSIQAIVNDDLGELTNALQAWGEAGSATVGDAVFALLTSAGSGGFGQTMDEDSQILFHTDHDNYVASGAAPSEATLNAARTKMTTRTDQNGRTVASRPRYLMHGPQLFSTVRKALASEELQSIEVDGAGGSTILSGGRNTVQDMNLQPIEEYRFSGSTWGPAWLLAAARRTVEVAGVGGPVSPRAEQSMSSDIPGLTYEMSMPFGVAALDYRGFHLNMGD